MQTALLTVLSILCPPLGVLVKKGWSVHVAINLGLTLLAYLPGLAHALYHCWAEDKVITPDTPIT